MPGRGEWRARAVACPRCGAGPQEKCVSKNGNTITGLHVARYQLAVRSGIMGAPSDSVPRARRWHDDWAEAGRDSDGNLILEYKPTGGQYRVVPVEEGQ